MSNAQQTPVKHYCGAYRPKENDRWMCIPDMLEKIQYLIGKWEWAGDGGIGPDFNSRYGTDEGAGDSGYEGMHFQWFMVTKEKTRITAIHKWSDWWAHTGIIQCSGNAESNIEYIRKESTAIGEVFEHGICPIKGKSTGLSTAVAWIRTSIYPTASELADKFPIEYVRHGRGLLELIKEKNRPTTIEAWSILPEEKLRAWQYGALRILDMDPKQQPHNRRINWFYDPVGGAGKSVFNQFLLNKFGKDKVIVMDCSAKERIVEALFEKPKPLLCSFDLERDYPIKNFNYTALEMIKNGMGFRKMYNPQTVIWCIPHIFVFSNSLPDESKFTADRWKIIKLSWPLEEIIRINDEDRIRRNA